jgi:hypothetical protein
MRADTELLNKAGDTLFSTKKIQEFLELSRRAADVLFYLEEMRRRGSRGRARR